MGGTVTKRPWALPLQRHLQGLVPLPPHCVPTGEARTERRMGLPLEENMLSCRDRRTRTVTLSTGIVLEWHAGSPQGHHQGQHSQAPPWGPAWADRTGQSVSRVASERSCAQVVPGSLACLCQAGGSGGWMEPSCFHPGLWVHSAPRRLGRRQAQSPGQAASRLQGSS